MQIVLARRQDSDQDYLSTVSVIEDGRTVRTQTIEVNHPLHYGGYHFYQHDYDPAGSRYTVLGVVSDSGLQGVYVGCILLAAGLVVHLLGRMRRRRREGKA